MRLIVMHRVVTDVLAPRESRFVNVFYANRSGMRLALRACERAEREGARRYGEGMKGEGAIEVLDGDEGLQLSRGFAEEIVDDPVFPKTLIAWRRRFEQYNYREHAKGSE